MLFIHLFIKRFSIYTNRAAGNASEEALDRLPTAATCMNLLKLPPYKRFASLNLSLKNALPIFCCNDVALGACDTARSKWSKSFYMPSMPLLVLIWVDCYLQSGQHRAKWSLLLSLEEETWMHIIYHYSFWGDTVMLVNRYKSQLLSRKRNR